MGDLGKPSWGGENCFCLDLENWQKSGTTPRFRYLSIFLNLCYLLVPCDKTMWRLRLRLRTNMSVPSVNTNILKRKICKDICSEIIKVHQKKEKDQEFQCDECEYKCSKRDTLRMHRHRNHKEESDIKTEEMWPMRVCIYQKGYSESTLQ